MVEAECPLVLVHGFCEDADMWDRLMPFFQDIAVIRINLPGFGGSAPTDMPSMKSYAQTVLAVLDAEKCSTCVLIGHSLGGYVALQFATDAPDRLAAYGLFHSHPFTDSSERLEGRRRAIDMLRAGKKDLYVAQLFPNLFSPEFSSTQPERVTAFIRNGQKQTTDGIIGALEAMMARENTTETLKKSTVPVLFLLGKQDSLIPSPEALSAAILPPISDIYLWDEVAHMGMEEAPTQAAQAIKKFYKRRMMINDK